MHAKSSPGEAGMRAAARQPLSWRWDPYTNSPNLFCGWRLSPNLPSNDTLRSTWSWHRATRCMGLWRVLFRDAHNLGRNDSIPCWECYLGWSFSQCTYYLCISGIRRQDKRRQEPGVKNDPHLCSDLYATYNKNGDFLKHLFPFENKSRSFETVKLWRGIPRGCLDASRQAWFLQRSVLSLSLGSRAHFCWQFVSSPKCSSQLTRTCHLCLPYNRCQLPSYYCCSSVFHNCLLMMMDDVVFVASI